MMTPEQWEFRQIDFCREQRKEKHAGEPMQMGRKRINLGHDGKKGTAAETISAILEQRRPRCEVQWGSLDSEDLCRQASDVLRGGGVSVVRMM